MFSGPNSTNISPVPFKRYSGLSHIVKVLTRDSGILDWCLTNNPKILCEPKQLPKIGSNDHYCVLLGPTPQVVQPTKRTIMRRDTRASRLRDLEGGLLHIPGKISLPWSLVKRSLTSSFEC